MTVFSISATGHGYRAAEKAAQSIANHAQKPARLYRRTTQMVDYVVLVPGEDDRPEHGEFVTTFYPNRHAFAPAGGVDDLDR